MTRVPVASLDLEAALARVAEDGEPVVLVRDGVPVAAIVAPEAAALLDQIEERLDLDAAREALAEPGSIPWEKLEAELGL